MSNHITEQRVRHLVRKALLEAQSYNADSAKPLDVQNIGTTAVVVTGVYKKEDTARRSNLMNEKETVVLPRSSSGVTFNYTPGADAASDVYTIVYSTPRPSGATPRYKRDIVTKDADFVGGPTTSVDVKLDRAMYSGPGAIGTIDDDEVLDPADFDSILAHGAGEEFKTIVDPTDPEFEYAVFYKKVPVRAWVVRSPTGDTTAPPWTKDNYAERHSQMHEISPTKYASSFKKVAAAFVKREEQENPAVTYDEAMQNYAALNDAS